MRIQKYTAFNRIKFMILVPNQPSVEGKKWKMKRKEQCPISAILWIVASSPILRLLIFSFLHIKVLFDLLQKTSITTVIFKILVNKWITKMRIPNKKRTREKDEVSPSLPISFASSFCHLCKKSSVSLLQSLAFLPFSV